MGVGISATILYSFPFPGNWLKIVGIVVWGITIGMFGVATIMTLLRFILYPDQFSKMLIHPGQSAFIACIPVGLATIIDMTNAIFGTRAWKALYALWWIDVSLTLFSGWVVVFIMFWKHSRTIETLNATIVLPVVPLIFCADTGGIITPNLPAQLRESTVILCGLLWGNGVLLAFCCIVIYINRLLLQNLPPRMITITSFLAIGPFAGGSFGLLYIADGLGGVLKARGFPTATVDAVGYGAISIAIMLQGFACFWVVVGMSSLAVNPPKAFHMSWWGLTFPLGAYVVAWYTLADHTDVYAFKVLGALFGVLEILMVLSCAAGTIFYAIYTDTVFRQAQAETSPDDLELTKKEVAPV
jgi:tellurite resistance protein TehA-like permease